MNIPELFNQLAAWLESIKQGFADAMSAQAAIDAEQNRQIAELYGLVNSGPIEPPIEPPTNPDIGEVDIVANSTLTPGQKVQFEALVSSSLQIETVEFFLDGISVNVEKQFKYESNIVIPAEAFEVSTKVTFTTGDVLDSSESFEPGDVPVVIVPPPPPTGGGGTSDIAEFNDFVTASDGMYYNLDASNEAERILSETEVEALFNTGASHMGKPNNRARIDKVPGTEDKAFTFIINNESGGYGDRLSSQKTNDPNNSTLYPDAKSVASYSELYFDSDKLPARTHFKCSSFTSKQGPPPSGSNSTGPNPRTSNPGQAEFVRWEFYSKKSQGSPENKGDLMKLYFGENTDWSADDYARMDQSDNLVMGAGAYTAQPNLPYKWQNMLYPCKPDSNGMPTKERLLIPTDKLIKSWMIWEGNTLNADNSGNYDGSAKWWLQIDGIHGGEPFLAAIMLDHLWVTGAPLIIGQAGVGAYFNSGDQPNEDNQFFVLKDEVYYKAF